VASEFGMKGANTRIRCMTGMYPVYASSGSESENGACSHMVSRDHALPEGCQCRRECTTCMSKYIVVLNIFVVWFRAVRA
jgi:hypothetical protein